MALQVKVLATKADRLNFIPGNYIVKEKNLFHKLASELYKCPTAS